MVQPQPGCVNLRHAGRTNHHIHHHMTLRPYHSHHTLQKQVRRTMRSTKIALGSRYSEKATAVPHGNLIGVIVSPKIRAIHNASILTTSIILTMQPLHLRRLHLHMTSICWFNQLTMHTVSPLWWFQPVGTSRMHHREGTRTNLFGHMPQSTRSNFNPLWPIDLIKPCKSNRSNLLQHITYMFMIQIYNYARWLWYHCRETGTLL